MTSASLDPRQLREAAEVLFTLFRCVSMKRANGVSEKDHLNFFRVYDGCLMDVAVISWCKVFGNNSEEGHWKKLFPVEEHHKLRLAIHKSVGGQMCYEHVWRETIDYRSKNVAHHCFDEAIRPKNHPHLEPLRASGLVVYGRIYNDLDPHIYSGPLPHPAEISGESLSELETHWKEIADTARRALSKFSESPGRKQA